MTRSRPGTTCPPSSSRCWRGDGDLRRIPRADRPRAWPHRRHPGGPGRPRRHADLLHHRRQRRLGRRHPAGLVQRDGHAQRDAWHRDDGVPAVQDRRLRHTERLQPLRGGVGARDEHAISVDQAGGLPLGWHPQRHHRALAQRLRRQGQDPQPVPSRDRCRPDHPGGGRTARADLSERYPAGAAGGCQHAAHPARRRGSRDTRGPVLRDVRQPRHLPQGLDSGDQTQHALD